VALSSLVGSLLVGSWLPDAESADFTRQFADAAIRPEPNGAGRPASIAHAMISLLLLADCKANCACHEETMW